MNEQYTRWVLELSNQEFGGNLGFMTHNGKTQNLKGSAPDENHSDGER